MYVKMLHDQMKSIKLLGIIVFIIGSVVGKLHLPRVVVPPYRMFNENARLDCPFDLGQNRLYAVKWYKDNEEFFRYVPRYRPPIHVHKVDGITVIMQGSDQKFVTIGPLDLRATGTYKCEVSAEGPSFVSVSGEGRMTVVHLPKEGPQISGKTRDEYEVGEYLALNCTSGYSFPPARLSWIINELPIEQGAKQISPPNRTGPLTINLQQQQSESTLNISLKPEHFNENGEAKVRCVASISTLFWQNGDERVVGNSRKLPQDFRYSSTNSFNSVVSSPVFTENREASLLVRGGSNPATEGSMWTVNCGVFLVILISRFLLVTNNTCNRSKTEKKKNDSFTCSTFSTPPPATAASDEKAMESKRIFGLGYTSSRNESNEQVIILR